MIDFDAESVEEEESPVEVEVAAMPFAMVNGGQGAPTSSLCDVSTPALLIATRPSGTNRMPNMADEDDENAERREICAYA